MKLVWLILALEVLLACSLKDESVSDPKDVEDISSMTRRDDGNFDIVCYDGSRIVATADQVRRGDVCSAETENYSTLRQDGALFIAVRTGVLADKVVVSPFVGESFDFSQAKSMCAASPGSQMLTKVEMIALNEAGVNLIPELNDRFWVKKTSAENEQEEELRRRCWELQSMARSICLHEASARAWEEKTFNPATRASFRESPDRSYRALCIR